MGNSIRDALERAYLSKGQEVPRVVREKPKKDDREKIKRCSSGPRKNGRGVSAPGSHSGKRRPKHTIPIEPLKTKPSLPKRQDTSDVSLWEAVYHGLEASQKRKRSKCPTAITQPPSPKIIIGVSPQLNPLLSGDGPDDRRIIKSCNQAGKQESICAEHDVDDVRELALGLDFGTSTVKVVIGDRSAGRAFAVPFFDALDISAYMLPSRLWESSTKYSLISGGTAFRDLKLSLLEAGDTTLAQRRAIAFLALVIRHARGWLFTRHAEIYKDVRIAWTLSLGMPAENYAVAELIRRYRHVAQAAWVLAGTEQDVISVSAVDNVATQVAKHHLDLDEGRIEIEVVPELCAQIYGFLKSSRFDPQAENNFLMVDIGAGTIDAALFNVARRRARWEFTFFATSVRPNGVVNLHRARTKWWAEALAKNGLAGHKIPIHGLNKSAACTDYLGGIPEHIEDYFSDVNIRFDDPSLNPDEVFFKRQVVAQVRGNTLVEARTHGLLGGEAARTGMPMFLCGGGTRMRYYNRLAGELKSCRGYSWLRATAQILEPPKDIEAPGVGRRDYDRLSVAYGLRSLKSGRLQEPFLPQPIRDRWSRLGILPTGT